jgi:hypothetical protein
MRRWLRDQLMLNLDDGGKPHPPEAVPAELLQALADLLLEALGNQNKAVEAVREVCDAFQDHA